MSGYVEKISVRSDTSFIHHTLLLNNPNWTIPRKKVILLLSHYWVLSLIAVFLRFNWNASLGVDDLGLDSFIYVPLPQSHWLIRFVSLNSLFTQLNVCICDSLLVWHMFLVSVTVWTGIEGSHVPNPNFQNWISRLLLNFTFVWQRRNRQEKRFSLLPSLYSFFIQGFARRLTDNLLVTTWPKSYICLTTCISTIDPSLTRLYSTLTRSTSSSFADTCTSNEAFSLSWNTTSPWNVQRWHLKCALE